MGFFDYLQSDSFKDSVQRKADSLNESRLKLFKEKLRNTSDAAVLRKWDEVSSDYSLDECYKDAVRDEMRRRGLY